MRIKRGFISTLILTVSLTFSATAKEATDYTDAELLGAGWSAKQISDLRNSARQTEASQDRSIHIDHYCGYFDSNDPGSIHPFKAESRVESLIDEIMEITGLPRNFEVIAGGFPNAAAITVRDKRVIAYNQSFLHNITRNERKTKTTAKPPVAKEQAE